MGVPFVQMTPDAIRARLDELDRHHAAYVRRDLDAELSEVLRSGGDIDALEAKHLEAERGARRLRVERTALEGELPNAIRRDGQSRLASLADEHDALKPAAIKCATDILKTWDAFKEAVAVFSGVQGSAESLTREGVNIARSTNASCPDLGTFQHSGLVKVMTECREQWMKMGGVEYPMNTVLGPKGNSLD